MAIGWRKGLAALGVLLGALAPGAGRAENLKALVIVVDGLRPDYVTPARMPNLHALGERGAVGAAHHAVFPTVTRVNSTSIATGSYPERHGILGNSVYFPAVDAEKGFDTGDYENLLRIDEAEGGHLVTAVSLAEVLDAQGQKLVAVSGGSSGSAFLLNPKRTGGGVINTDVRLPASIDAAVLEVLGPPPEYAKPNLARHEWVARGLIEYALPAVDPTVAFMWFSDPDGSAHSFGMGSPEMEQGVRAVDEKIGRILADLERRGLQERVNVFVVSDHGFSTHTGGANPLGTLMRLGLKKSPSSTDVVLVDGMVFVKDRDPKTIAALARAFQAEPWCGAIFTKTDPEHPERGIVPGTLPFGLIHYEHERAPDLLLDANWTNGQNEHGFAGETTQPGKAGHGTSSPWDVHNTLIAAGPDINTGQRSETPTGNVDIAPTLCYLLGLAPPKTMTGRVMRELLRAPAPAPRITHETHTVATRDSRYTLTAHTSTVDGHRYLDYTKTERAGHPPE